MDQESAEVINSCDLLDLIDSSCDIIGELLGKHIYNVTDQILFYLDWSSLKNVGLVSKSWRAALLVALKRILLRDNPNWSAAQLSSWRKFRAHLQNDFKVPVQDPYYVQRFCNSINLITDHLQMDAFWTQPKMTLDYLQYLRRYTEDTGDEDLNWIKMNDNFIVAWESSTGLFKCWSRRTLSPIDMDKTGNFPLLRDVVDNFHLFGNYFFCAELGRWDYNFSEVVLTRIDLDLRSRGMDEEKLKASIYVEHPTDKARLYIDHLAIVDDMILLIVSVRNDKDCHKDAVTVQRNVERQETRKILKCDLLLVLPVLYHFFDKDFLIVGDTNDGFRTYSLHPPNDGGGTVELRWIASFELVGPMFVDYRDGLLASAATDIGNITLVDVSNGSLLKCVSTPINFFIDVTEMRLMSKDFLIFSEGIDEEPSSPGDGPFVGKDTTFHIWDLRSIMNQPNREVESTPISTFTTLTSSSLLFLADEMGIVAVIEDDSAKGIQVLSFLPACSHCKRVAKPALLTKCNGCKSATYCSEECQWADWNPHHELICAKVIPLSFA